MYIKIQNIKKQPHYTNLYFHIQCSLLEKERCKLLYHATKANLVPPNINVLTITPTNPMN